MTADHAAGTGAGTLASEVVYVNGWIPAVLLFAFVFVSVASSGSGWSVVAGVAVLAVSGLFAFFMWRSLTDYPLTYRDGDRPVLQVQGTGLYHVWSLAPGARVRTTLAAEGGADAGALGGDLSLGYDCAEARVRWRISGGADADAGAADALLASGTFGEGDRRALTGTALRAESPGAVLLTAVRLDDATCDTTLTWKDPGFEGPGHGPFRFLFPVPAA
ncbi:hypothetical protein [Streptomyces sp. MAR4 CNX-425]|uniref:hypothetical protein n=1 Tax=Streptomyces sp. MAR4 CNX-425 TaxID=3406343 RepID=UPI003B509B76